MGKGCPFCGGQVDEDLVRYGGPCPKCFAEIPGEEVPTDPGEAANAVQAARDRRRVAFKALIPVVLSLPVVVVLVGAAVYLYLRPEPVIPVMDFDAFPEYDIPLVAASEPSAAEEGTPEAPQPPRRSAPSAEERAAALARGADRVAQSSNMGIGDDEVAHVDPGRGTRGGTADLGGPAGPDGGVEATQTQKGSLDLSLDITQSRRGGVYTTSEEKQKMIGEHLKLNMQRTTVCYNRQLMQDPDLEGRWRVAFTVTKDGDVRDPSIASRETFSEDFEACLLKEIGRWKFERMNQDQPVQKTFTFHRRG